METYNTLVLKKIGEVRSTLRQREDCPLQGEEGAPEAWINIEERFMPAFDSMAPGDTVILLTWLHIANRNTLKCYPRNQVDAPHVGVFSTRSPDRPNPIGLHTVKILAVEDNRIKVYPLEALDGTIVLDIKVAL
jgi:tRNA-Thr(GGU) m(6)t(6)A37 methyltransferase TsaA